jgi:transcriptional regulator with XRE-family HTH domain
VSARGTCTGRHPVHARCADPECYRYGAIPLAAVVAAARAAKGWTQTELAGQVNRMMNTGQLNDDAPAEQRIDEPIGPVTAQYVSDVENNRRTPGLMRLRAFADALGVSMDELVGRFHAAPGERYPHHPNSARRDPGRHLWPDGGPPRIGSHVPEASARPREATDRWGAGEWGAFAQAWREGRITAAQLDHANALAMANATDEQRLETMRRMGVDTTDPIALDLWGVRKRAPAAARVDGAAGFLVGEHRAVIGENPGQGAGGMALELEAERIAIERKGGKS